MPALPIAFLLEGRLCVVIGGGAVGRRKALTLQQAGARVRLVSPGVDPMTLPGVEVFPRPYRPGDLAGACLAFAAAENRQVNAAVADEARRSRIPVNIADRPEEGDFYLPALLSRGDLTLAVATSGRSPALAAILRDLLGNEVGPEWETVLEIAAALRRKKLTREDKAGYSQEILRRLVLDGLPILITRGAKDEIDRLLTAAGGPDCSLDRLGIRLPKGET